MKKLCLSVSLVALLTCAAPVQAQTYGGDAQTAAETRLSSLEEQMRSLGGRIEQLEHTVQRLSQSMTRLQEDTDARLTRIETVQNAAAQAAATQPAPPPVVVQAPTPVATTVPAAPANAAANTAPSSAAVDAAVTGTLGALKLQDGKVTGGIKNPQSPPLPNVPADYGLSPEEQYDRAFTLLRQANYAEAEKAFKTFLDKNPKDKLLDQAKYWYAETLYVKGSFGESAVAFADAYQQNPQGIKAPDSLLKLAMSLGAINKVGDACVTLRELKSKYPKAPATLRARADEQGVRLKCGN
jgi:tol-pal system protein YbgF